MSNWEDKSFSSRPATKAYRKGWEDTFTARGTDVPWIVGIDRGADEGMLISGLEYGPGRKPRPIWELRVWSASPAEWSPKRVLVTALEGIERSYVQPKKRKRGKGAR